MKNSTTYTSITREKNRDILLKVLNAEKKLRDVFEEEVDWIRRRRRELLRKRFRSVTGEKDDEKTQATELLFTGKPEVNQEYNSMNHVKLYRRLKEIEGGLKRCEFRYEEGKKLVEGNEKDRSEWKALKTRNIGYIQSLVKELTRNSLKVTAEEIQLELQKFEQFTRKYARESSDSKRPKRESTSQIRLLKVNSIKISLENKPEKPKLELPKLKEIPRKHNVKTSRKTSDQFTGVAMVMNFTRPHTFSYFPKMNKHKQK